MFEKLNVAKNTQANWLQPGRDDSVFKKQTLPSGVLSYEDFCKEQKISTGLADCDLLARNSKKARAMYNEYLIKNGVQPQKTLEEKLQGDGSIFGFGKKLPKEALYCQAKMHLVTPAKVAVAQSVLQG